MPLGPSSTVSVASANSGDLRLEHGAHDLVVGIGADRRRQPFGRPRNMKKAPPITTTANRPKKQRSGTPILAAVGTDWSRPPAGVGGGATSTSTELSPSAESPNSSVTVTRRETELDPTSVMSDMSQVKLIVDWSPEMSAVSSRLPFTKS